MAQLAFLGLGQMGAPMAARLLEAGHDLVVWNRSPEKAEPLAGRGARVASSPADAAGGVEAAITMLATPEAVDDVVFGNRGLARALSSGQTLIEMSTIGPEAVRWIAERLPDGVPIADAPVLGTVPQATNGTLKVFFGGSEDAFHRWRDVLAALGTPIHVGPSGAGAAMKLVVNSTLGALMTALGEALTLGEALELDRKTTLDVLSESSIGPTARSKRSKIESGSYDPNFKLSLAVKDLQLVTETARRVGVDPRVTEAARAWFEAAERDGLGDRDYSAVVAHILGGRGGAR